MGETFKYRRSKQSAKPSIHGIGFRRGNHRTGVLGYGSKSLVFILSILALLVYIIRSGHSTPEDEMLARIPRAVWPINVKSDDSDFENIQHPGDGSIIMSVPKFWSPPIHNKQLMTRGLAMKIGSCITPDALGNFDRGDECPLNERTIFLGIASYRDWQCRHTVESAILRAKYPERIRVGVVDQIVDGEDVVCNSPIYPCESDPGQALCQRKDQVDVYEMEAHLAVGPMFARHISNRMYRGEYYATQSDAHVTYTQDWDVSIIEQHEATENEMAVLTTYLSDVIGAIDDKTGESLVHSRPIMCNTHFVDEANEYALEHQQEPENEPPFPGIPQLEPFWAAGFSFSRGHFNVNVPYDLYEPMIFQGEEISMGIRGFTVGYDYYAPDRSVCFHHYKGGKNTEARAKVSKYTENRAFAGKDLLAIKRLLGIVEMNPETNRSTWNHAEEDVYGIGGVRTPAKFYNVFGMNVVKKTSEFRLCRFVNSGRMHVKFTKHLRSDGMGIDYNTIHFRFKNPRALERQKQRKPFSLEKGWRHE